LQKVPVEKKSTKASMLGFPRFVLIYRVFGCFAAMGVQKHHKKRFAKKSCRKVFTPKKTQKNDFFVDFV
jgi:hypothetical protein